MNKFEEIEPYINTFILCNKYYILDQDILHKSVYNSLALISYFYKEYINQYEKLPFRINLIDDIRANENAHSRILSSILKIHDSTGENFVIKSFFKMLGEPFSSLVVSAGLKVKITNEENRIDIKIRDKDYSIIIENKIHGAQDQNRQIERYIEAENKLYKHEQIYILYLTRQGGSPSDESISNDLILQFNGRYREISYKIEILDWLNTLLDEPLQNNCFQSSVARAAIIQYKDHLDGIFSQRKGEIEMDEKISKWLEQELNIIEKPVNAKIEILIEKNNELNKLSDALNGLLKKAIKQEFKDLIIGLKLNEFRPLKYDDKFGYDDEGILCFWQEGWKRFCIAFVCCVPKNRKSRQIYCGIYDSHGKSDSKYQKLFKNLLGSDTVEETNWWPWGKYLEYYIPEKITDIDDNYEQIAIDMVEIIDVIKNNIIEMSKKLLHMDEM